METFPQTPGSEHIQKQYPYRYSWSSILLIMLVGGSMTLVFVWKAFSEKKASDWFFALFSFAMLFISIWLIVVNVLGKLTVKITQTGIYLPSIWNWKSSIYIPFSAISNVELFKVQGNIYLRISAGKKKYSIVHRWFPHKEDFQEIMEIAQKQLPIFYSHNSPQ